MDVIGLIYGVNFDKNCTFCQSDSPDSPKLMNNTK